MISQILPLAEQFLAKGPQVPRKLHKSETRAVGPCVLQVPSAAQGERKQAQARRPGLAASEGQLRRGHGAAFVLLQTTLQPVAQIPRRQGVSLFFLCVTLVNQ